MVMLSGIWTVSPTPRGQSDTGLQCKQFIPEFRKMTVIIAKILFDKVSFSDLYIMELCLNCRSH